MQTYLVAAAMGILVGIVVGALGGGGGILTVPALVYLLGMTPHMAATSSLVIVGATSLVSLPAHARAGRVDWRGGTLFAAAGVVATVAGSWLAWLVSGSAIMIAFAALLAVVGLLMARQGRAARRAEDAEARAVAEAEGEGAEPEAESPGREDRVVRRGRRSVWLLVAMASIVGALTGFFGVGGGFAAVPALVLAMRYPTRLAVGTSLLVIALNSAVGLLARLPGGLEIDWGIVAAFAVASMAASALGTRISARARASTLTTAFAMLLLAVAAVTAVESIAVAVS